MKLALLIIPALLMAQTPDQSKPHEKPEMIVRELPPKMYIELGQLIAAQQNWNQRAQQICQGPLTRDYKCAPKPEKEPVTK